MTLESSPFHSSNYVRIEESSEVIAQASFYNPTNLIKGAG